MKTAAKQAEPAPRAGHISAAKATAGPSAAARLLDQRPGAIAQRQRQAAIDSSPRAQQAATAQRAIDNSPRQQNASAPAQRKANKTGLPDHLKAGVENLSGHSLDDVRVHYNSTKPAQLQAHAYAQGTDIHLGPGQEKHLPHEAWHVVQQKQGRVRPTRQLKGKVNINDNAGLEKEADVMGAKAFQMQAKPISSVMLAQRQTSVVQMDKVPFYKGTYVSVTKQDKVVHGVITRQLDENGTKYEFRVGGTEMLSQARREDIKLHETPRAMLLNGDAPKAKSKPVTWNDTTYDDYLLAFYQSYRKGKQLYRTMLDGLSIREKADKNTSEAYENRYSEKSNVISGVPENMHAVKDDTEGWVGVDTSTKGNEKTAYGNYVNPKEGKIIAKHNFAKDDKNTPETEDSTRLNNSEILVNQYKKAGGSLANLKEIVRANIVNSSASLIMQTIKGKRGIRGGAEQKWTEDKEEFYALLGTENVQGTVFMLLDHKQEMGFKKIVAVYTQDVNSIRIELGV